MAHYAEISPDNVVLNVLYVTNDIITDENNNEVDSLGVQHLRNNINPNANYVRTSYSGSIREKYAGVGDLYHTESDKFYSPQPFPSWTLNTDTLVWEPPTAKPTLTEEQSNVGSFYYWNEETRSWVFEDMTPPAEEE